MPVNRVDSSACDVFGNAQKMNEKADGAVRLEVEGLAFARNDCVLFSELSFSLEPGQVLQIEGPNGSGKTTLLRVLCGLTAFEEGDVRWGGESIRDAFSDYVAELAYVGHAAGVKEELTPLENLEVARAMGRARQGVEPEDVLDRLGLPPEHEDVPCRKLSAGQRRRVALGRLLITEARLWVLDEPFTALDRAGRVLIEGLLSEHAQAGGMAVLTTHHTMRLGECEVKSLNLDG